MTNLTAKQRAFIGLMSENEELARHGFALLLKRPDFVAYFDALIGAGLFEPSRNPRPVPVAEEGYVRILYWSAVDYLVAVATLAGEQGDLELAGKVMAVVRNVSLWRDEDGKPQENYHTSQKFATILGLLPTVSVTRDDMQFVSAWLSNRFEQMLVSRALDETVLPHFLASPNPEDWAKAAIALEHCTAIQWPHDKSTNSDENPETLVKEFWLRRLISNHASSFGSKLGARATAVFEQRVREVFKSDIHRTHSEIFRPAVADNNQNHSFRAAENLMVSGLRDVLLAWTDCDAKSVRPYVEHLVGDELQILRRIGIYVLDKQWTNLRDLYRSVLEQEPFSPGQLHELYSLLDAHFQDFTTEEQDQTLSALRSLPMPTWGDDPQNIRKRLQHRWLSSMVGKGVAAADEWFAELQSDPNVGPLPDHPDFSSYMTTRQGPGSSPYSVAEILGFASVHVLSEQLNAFEQKDELRGPTVDGLTSVLQDAARAKPAILVSALPEMLTAKPLFQQSVIRGLKEAWDAQETSNIHWAQSWPQIVAFFERLLENKDFRQYEDEVHRDWLVTAIADCLHAGTQRDEHAYAADMLPRTRALVATLLLHATAASDFPKDPMMLALNTPKGRVIEALFSQALREARVSDQADGQHEESWRALQPLFDVEISKCRNSNFEFSTLCGAYLSQLDYLNFAWTTEMIPRIFPEQFPDNDRCAIAGVAYTSFTGIVYDHLLKGGAIDRALRYELTGRDARGKLLERIAAAYLWGMESLASPRLDFVFSTKGVDDLTQIAWVLWTVRNQELTGEQQERILQFWERCITWSRTLPAIPVKLLSSLSALACYLEDADGRNRSLLLAVAPYVHINHNSYEFVGELLRLAEVSPDGVTNVLETMIIAQVPEYDYEDRLREILRTLEARGKRIEVLRLLERMRSLPGMPELFDTLTRGNVSSGN